MMLSGHVVPLLRLCNRTGLLSCSITPQVYIPCMPPRNHAGYTNALSGHSRSLLAQFGLTPKSRRGLAAGEAVGAVDPLDAL